MTAPGWPEARPDLPVAVDGWFEPENAEFLSRFVRPGITVLEIGCWLGKSTLWLAEEVGPAGRVIAVDHFLGSDEHRHEPAFQNVLPTLWEQFIANCWDHRDVITPVRAPSPTALAKLHVEGAAPDLIYVDGDHRYESALRDLMMSALLWPEATVTGDDFTLRTVEDAASNVAFCLRRNVVHSTKRRCFALVPRENRKGA